MRLWETVEGASFLAENAKMRFLKPKNAKFEHKTSKNEKKSQIRTKNGFKEV